MKGHNGLNHQAQPFDMTNNIYFCYFNKVPSQQQMLQPNQTSKSSGIEGPGIENVDLYSIPTEQHTVLLLNECFDCDTRLTV